MKQGSLTRWAMVCAGVLVLLQVVGYFTPSVFTWGFHALAFLPPVYLIAYVVVAIAIVIFFQSIRVEKFVQISSRWMDQKPLQFIVASSVIAVVGVLFLRVRAPLLGDGFFLVRNFGEALHGIGPLLYRNEPLATTYYYALTDFFRPTTFTAFLNVFLFADLLLTISFLVITFFVIRALLDHPQDRLLAYLFVSSLPYVQLFFGYVETYALLLVLLSVYVLVVFRYLQGKFPFALLPVFFLVMALSHYSALLLAPSLLYLAYIEYKLRGTGRIATGFSIAIAMLLAILALVKFQFEHYVAPVPHSRFLPIYPSSDPDEIYSTVYTLFSLYHLIDVVNFLVLLCAPACFLIGLAIRYNRTAMVRSREVRFLTLSILPVLGFLIAVKFDLGPAKDWDVLASYCLLPALLAIIVFFRQDDETRRRAFSIIAAIAALNTGCYLILNSSVTPSIERYRTVTDKRTISPAAYYTSTLHLAYYYHEIRDTVRAVSIWENYVQQFPSDQRGYQNVVRNLYNLQSDERYDRIARMYDEWLIKIPRDTVAVQEYSNFCLNIGNTRFSSGSYNDARTYYRRAISLDSTLAKAYNNLGSVYAQEGKLDSAIALFRKAIQLDDKYSDAYYNLGIAYGDKGNRAQGLPFIRQSAELGNPRAQQLLNENGGE